MLLFESCLLGRDERMPRGTGCLPASKDVLETELHVTEQVANTTDTSKFAE